MSGLDVERVIEHLVESLNVNAPVLDFALQFAHQNFLGLLGMLAPFALQHPDHVLGEVGTDQDFLRQDLPSGEPLEQVLELLLRDGYRGARVEDFHPDLGELLLAHRIGAHEALEAHVVIEVDARVRVAIVNAERKDNPAHDVVEPVLLDV